MIETATANGIVIVEATVQEHQVVGDRGGLPDLRLGLQPPLKGANDAEVRGIHEGVGDIRLEHDVEEGRAAEPFVDRLEILPKTRGRWKVLDVVRVGPNLSRPDDRDDEKHDPPEQDEGPVLEVQVGHGPRKAVEGASSGTLAMPQASGEERQEGGRERE